MVTASANPTTDTCTWVGGDLPRERKQDDILQCMLKCAMNTVSMALKTTIAAINYSV